MTVIYILIGVMLVLTFWVVVSYNGLVKSKLLVENNFSQIKIQCKKRFDLVPNLVETVKGFAAHEKELFTQVIELRRGMGIAEMNEKSGQLDAMSARINAVAENYPELRSAEIFRELQSGIRDAEQHLQAARRLYNSNVSIFNQLLVTFPKSIVASNMRLTKQIFFKADEAKKEDVKMEF